MGIEKYETFNASISDFMTNITIVSYFTNHISHNYTIYEHTAKIKEVI